MASAPAGGLDEREERLLEERLRDERVPRGYVDGDQESDILVELIHNLYAKLDPRGEGRVASVPGRQDLTLSPFESNLLEMARPRLEFECQENGGLDRATVFHLLCFAMDVECVIDANGRCQLNLLLEDKRRKPRGAGAKFDAYVPESTLRAGRKEPKKDASTSEMDECTFKPKVRPKPALYASRPRRAVKLRPAEEQLTTAARQELRDLEECTFQPNLHKSMWPRLRSRSCDALRDGRDGSHRGTRRPPTHRRVARRRNWQETLRGDPPIEEPVAGKPSTMASLMQDSHDADSGFRNMDPQPFRFGKDTLDTRGAKERSDWRPLINLQRDYDHVDVSLPAQSDAVAERFAERFLAVRADEPGDPFPQRFPGPPGVTQGTASRFAQVVLDVAKRHRLVDVLKHFVPKAPPLEERRPGSKNCTSSSKSEPTAPKPVEPEPSRSPPSRRERRPASTPSAEKARPGRSGRRDEGLGEDERVPRYRRATASSVVPGAWNRAAITPANENSGWRR